MRALLLVSKKIVSKVSTFIFKKDIEFLTNSKILPLFYYKTVLTTYHLRNTYIDNQTQKKNCSKIDTPNRHGKCSIHPRTSQYLCHITMDLQSMRISI